jgi:hypothetical protein
MGNFPLVFIFPEEQLHTTTMEQTTLFIQLEVEEGRRILGKFEGS